MSDEQTTETTEPENTQEAPAQEPDWKKFSRQWEDRAKAANAELEELRKRAAKLDELEEAQKTAEQKREEELEQLRSRAAKLEEDLAKKDREVLVQKVAGLKGVKPRYLFGDTEEELLASADEYLEDAKPLANKATGIIPSAGTGDPKVEASTLNEVRERAKAFAGKK